MRIILKDQTLWHDSVRMCVSGASAFLVKAGGFLCSYLICFLVEAGRHLQQCAALIQRRSKSLPLLLQLPGDLLDLLRGVMARLQQPVPDWHDPVNVHVHVLGLNKQTHKTLETSLDFNPLKYLPANNFCKRRQTRWLTSSIAVIEFQTQQHWDAVRGWKKCVFAAQR